MFVNTINQTYYMFDHDKNNKVTIGNKDDLILFLSRKITDYLGKSWWVNKKWNPETRKYDFNITESRIRNILLMDGYSLFKMQNLTGKNFYFEVETIKKENINDEGESFYDYTRIWHKLIKPYTFYCGDRIIDIRIFKEDIIKQVLYHGIVEYYSYKNRRFYWHHRICHTYGGKYHGRKSTGWKDHKMQKQWMYNIVNRKEAEEFVSFKKFYNHYPKTKNNLEEIDYDVKPEVIDFDIPEEWLKDERW